MRGTFFGGVPYKKDYNNFGSISGSLYLWNLPNKLSRQILCSSSLHGSSDMTTAAPYKQHATCRMGIPQKAGVISGVPVILGIFLWFLIIRIIVCWGLYWGCLFLF